MKVILHIPHTSLKVPNSFYKFLTISKEEFEIYNLKTSDLLVDYLFKDVKGIRIKPKYSRMYCDVEKFKDENLEIMAKYGQGVVYTHTYDGKLFHKHNEKYKKKVLKYYDNYHNKVNKIIKRLLKRDPFVLILDIHSFGETQAKYISNPPYKDICIGIEKEYYDKKILNELINRINEKGYTYQINYPYKGSFVPSCILNKKIKGKVVSIMIEINKRLYL